MAVMIQFILFSQICQLAFSAYEVSDESLYKLKWASTKGISDSSDSMRNILINTKIGEKFECNVPVTTDVPEGYSSDSNVTFNEEILLGRLFEARPCNIRTEFYWSYELCHLKYVRQFHEELLPDKSSKVQEYFLGYFKKEPLSLPSQTAERPTILLGGSSYPYFPVTFVDGTPCDLTGERRTTTVLYICLEGEEGRIVQVSETESCQYQVVFATNHLCSHPQYRLPKPPVRQLFCAPREGSILKPAALVQFEKEQEHLSQHGISNLAALFNGLALKNIRVEANRKNNMIVYRIRTVDSTEESESEDISTELDDTSLEIEDVAKQGDTGEAQPRPTKKQTAPDEAYRARFLEFAKGKLCLQGRTGGWWQYEICLRSNVTQYHTNSLGRRTQVILLGNWDRKAHLKWLTKNQKPSTESPNEGLDLLYADGDYCESIKSNREVIVKLRCNAAATGIHLSFSERSECRYTALVESSGFCGLPSDSIKALVY